MNDKHIVSSFDRDLESIQATVMKMGGLVEKSLMDAATALQTQDIELAEAVRKSDKVVDELDLTIKSDAARLLALAHRLRVICAPFCP